MARSRRWPGLTPGFDWREEAWETLTHELRHHVEWRARTPDLEDLRLGGGAELRAAGRRGFDPGFYLDGDSPVPGVYEVDGDYFIDHVVRTPPAEAPSGLAWGPLQAPRPAGLHLPAFLTIEGVVEPPPGELLLVLRRKPRLTDLFRAAELFTAVVPVTAVVGA